MHGKNTKPHGLASAVQPRMGEPNPCNVSNMANYTGSLVEEMADSPGAGPTPGTVGNGSNNESRLPPPGAFDWRMPDANIGLSTGLSPQAVMTPDSLSNSEPNGTTNTQTSSRHGSHGAFSPPGSHDPISLQQAQHMTSGHKTAQTTTISEFPVAANWSTTNTDQDFNNVDGFVNMDLGFDLPTPSDFIGGGSSTNVKTSSNIDFGNDAFLNMAYNETTTIPVRPAGSNTGIGTAIGTMTDTSLSADTPNSWNMMSTGMTPNFNDMTNTQDWDNLMENLADWDPNTAQEMLLP